MTNHVTYFCDRLTELKVNPKAPFLQKNQMMQNGFFDISNADIAQFQQKFYVILVT